ncbi:MAG: S1C family serine protease [Eubacterium sp.]
MLRWKKNRKNNTQNSSDLYNQGNDPANRYNYNQNYSNYSGQNGNNYTDDDIWGDYPPFDDNQGYNSGSNYSGGPSPSNQSRLQPIKKKTLALMMAGCMLATSAVSVGGYALYSNYFGSSGSSTSATNYKLTSSKTTLTTDSIVKKAENSVVSITVSSTSSSGGSGFSGASSQTTTSAGSGVIIQSNGYILTCEHVIEDASSIKVTLKNGKSYSAKLIGTDTDNDLAVIKITATGLTAATYGNSSKLEVGDSVVAIGNALGELSNTATTGIVSALDRELTINNQKLTLLQTDASVNPGNSGGGLFDSSGNLIGIVESKSTGSDVEGLGFAVPINTAAKSAAKIIKTGGNIGSSSSSGSNSSSDSDSNSQYGSGSGSDYGSSSPFSSGSGSSGQNDGSSGYGSDSSSPW